MMIFRKTLPGKNKILIISTAATVITLGGILLFANQQSHDSPDTKPSGALIQDSDPVTEVGNTAPASTPDNDTYQDPSKQQVTTVGGSLTLPRNWSVQNDKAPEGEEYTEIIANSQSDDANSFRMQLRIAPIQDSNYQPAAIRNGSTTTLPNGLEIWEQNESVSKRDGNPSFSCPVLQLVSKDSTGYHFSKKISKGRYLTIQAGFCMFESAKPTLTYKEQLASKEWKDAINYLSTLKIKEL